MIVRSLEICAFRNLKDAVFSPCEKMNIICGSNAQGKTNLIEAIWLFTGSKSFRGSKDSELLKIGEKKGGLKLDFELSGRNENIELLFDGSRSAMLGGMLLDSPMKLAGEFCAVIFSPEHMSLIKEGPSLRRKFIDAAICQIKPRYATLLMEYKKSLAQRNALLKDIPYHSDLMDTLEIWDEKLSFAGAQIIFVRLRYLKRLEQKASFFYGGIAGDGEELTFQYISGEQSCYSLSIENQKEACEKLKQTLFKELTRLRAEDIENGFTHAGPHRDDLLMDINTLSAKNFGSQGQQRSVILSLKLAEASILTEITGEPPVLLLDDVLSELDHSRQNYLLNNISGMQVFITCCDSAINDKLSQGNIFYVNRGAIS